ncbi:transcription factor SPT20 homolog [Rattus rattus]|uniref:transcription factor SPT20 homolog n=1 Tax=Rattus rattus TaxID=10117 RepID=UPI0013F31097|nr:transcription factor SPT20 homolog [Rattus rattus]
MEQHLAEALEQTDDIIETVQQEPPPARPVPSGEKSLHEKLYDIYVEECEKEAEVEGLRSNVNLLEKLLRREALPCLVVNLYPENQGYSLMLKDKEGVLIEPFPVPYLGQKLLEYLDAEELPSFLIDVLEKSPVNVFHHGCVIAEIRDYRQCTDVSSASSTPAYQTRHILLRPTMQSLVSDVESITSDNRQWTEEEKLELESQLILATAEPLCLDPSVAVACTANRLLFNQQKMMTDSMRQCFTSHEWPYLELEEEQYICTTPPDASTMVACRKQAETKQGDQYDLKIAEAEKCVDTWKQRPCELEASREVDVNKYARGKQMAPCDDAESTAWPLPEVNDYPFVCEEGSQPWEPKPSTSTAQSLSDPFFSPEASTRLCHFAPRVTSTAAAAMAAATATTAAAMAAATATTAAAVATDTATTAAAVATDTATTAAAVATDTATTAAAVATATATTAAAVVAAAAATAGCHTEIEDSRGLQSCAREPMAALSDEHPSPRKVCPAASALADPSSPPDPTTGLEKAIWAGSLWLSL